MLPAQLLKRRTAMNVLPSAGGLLELPTVNSAFAQAVRGAISSARLGRYVPQARRKERAMLNLVRATALAACFFPTIALATCPGNLLTGEQRPRGHAKWFWTLDTKNNTAVIQKSKDAFTGKVDMSCSDGKWFARLYEMSHGGEYNCSGTVVGNAIKNGVCTANAPPVIDVTGTFSTLK